MSVWLSRGVRCISNLSRFNVFLEISIKIYIYWHARYLIPGKVTEAHDETVPDWQSVRDTGYQEADHKYKSLLS